MTRLSVVLGIQVFSIPKLIRHCFMFDRKLLADLSRDAYDTLKEYMADTPSTQLRPNKSKPGCACSIQTFGDFLAFNPHCHIIISDGNFDEQGGFRITLYYDTHTLEHLFRHKVLKMLFDKGAITQWHIDLLMSWRHRIYEVHPLTCPTFNGTMRILAFVEGAPVIRKILEHQRLWDIAARPPPKGKGPIVIADEEPMVVYSENQVIEYEEAPLGGGVQHRHGHGLPVRDPGA